MWSRFIIGFAFLAAVTVSAVLGSGDANEDGCVDLKDYAILQGEFTGPCSQQDIVYLTATLGDGRHTITQPRAGEAVFHITGVWLTGGAAAWVGISLPPEFGLDSSRATLSLYGVRRYQLVPPYPFPSSLELDVDSLYGIGLVLVGYYDDAMPVVEQLRVESR